jgi:hypothetical protein
MDDILRHLPQVPQWVRALHVNPWAVAIGAGVIAAWLEQRIMHRHAPPFTAAHRGVAAGPPPQEAQPAKPQR